MSSAGIDSFSGPLFIVGLPRSGTKLLRTLLNENDRISIPEVETHFLPYWYKNWSSYGNLAERDLFENFYAKAMSLPYFIYLSELRPRISADEWFDACASFTLAEVFEALLRYDAIAPVGSDIIWGDKTPSYLTHMPFIKHLYPTGKFIHIVRDVRDYCLSSHQAWGKNMYRAAQLWADRLHKADKDSRQIGGDYLLLRYEDLINNPHAILLRVCDYLGVPFQEKMLFPSKVAENLGDTRGKHNIVAGNSSKYKNKMPMKVQIRIEQLAGAELQNLGYPLHFNVPNRRISGPMMLCIPAHGWHESRKI